MVAEAIHPDTIDIETENGLATYVNIGIYEITAVLAGEQLKLTSKNQGMVGTPLTIQKLIIQSLRANENGRKIELQGSIIVPEGTNVSKSGQVGVFVNEERLSLQRNTEYFLRMEPDAHAPIYKFITFPMPNLVRP